MTKTDSRGRWFRRVEIALWVLVAGALLYRVTPPPDVGRLALNEVAPPFTVRTLNGEEVSLRGLEGDVVLVNFWATWCPPCRLEMPGFQSAYERYRDRGFTVVGLAADVGGPRVVQSFVRENGITYPVAMAPDDVRMLYGGVDALPQSFLLDRNGVLRQVVHGVFSEGTLMRAVDQLLAEEAQ